MELKQKCIYNIVLAHRTYLYNLNIWSLEFVQFGQNLGGWLRFLEKIQNNVKRAVFNSLPISVSRCISVMYFGRQSCLPQNIYLTNGSRYGYIVAGKVACHNILLIFIMWIRFASFIYMMLNFNGAIIRRCIFPRFSGESRWVRQQGWSYGLCRRWHYTRLNNWWRHPLHFVEQVTSHARLNWWHYPYEGVGLRGGCGEVSPR